MRRRIDWVGVGIVVAIVLAIVVLRLSAQTATGYVLRVYPAGSATVKVTVPIPSTAVACNQAPPAVGTTNPSRAVFDDPAVAGRVCIWADAPTGGPLTGQPDGNYEATLAATNAAGASAESARAPFSRISVPPVPLGVRVAP